MPETRDAASAIDLVLEVTEKIPRAGPTAILIALILWDERKPVALADIRRRINADNNAASPSAAVKRLQNAGFIRTLRPARGYGISAEWISQRERNPHVDLHE